MRQPACPSPKLLLATLALATGLIALPSCSLRLHPPPVPEAVHSVSSSSACLSQAGDILDRFQNGTLSATDHDAFYDCTHRALSTFMNFTSGENASYYKPEELGGFLTKYFLAGKPIQPALLSEAMVLKSALVGGPTDRLSRDDLNRILAFCQTLRGLTAQLRPLMPLTAPSLLARGYNGTEFEKALATFTGAMNAFGAVQKNDQEAYSFDHFGALMQALQTFLYPNGVPAGHWTDTLLRAAKVLPGAKAILISPPSDQIAPADWAKVYRLAPRYYVAYLRVSFYFHSPFNTFEANGIDTFEQLFDSFNDTFNYVLEQHPGQKISSDEIDALVQSLFDQKMLPEGVQPAAARQFIGVVFGRLLGGSGATSQFDVTKDSLSRFQENVRYLLEGAHAAEALYRPKFGDRFVTGSLTAAEIAAASDSALLAATTLKNDLSRQSIADLKATPTAVRTVFPGTESMVLIPEHGLPDQFSFVHLLKIQALRSLNRLLIEGYGSPGANGLTDAQVNAFVADVFPLLTSAGLVTTATEAQVPKLLTEASLFLYSSDGQPKLSMNEALELESLVLSTLENAPDIQKKLAIACGLTPKGPGAAAVPIGADCYKQKFTAHFDKIWKYLPGLARYARSLSPADQANLFGMMTFLHTKPAGGAADLYTTADTEAFLLMPYYVELLFSRFDTDGNGLLDNKEATLAYPVFEPFIATKAIAKGYTSPKDFSAIFNFLLAYRKLPTEDEWDYAKQRYVLGDKAFTDDRGQVMQIFAKLLAL